MENKTDKRKFSCTLCEYKSDRQKLLERHHQIHTGVKPYKCNICDKSFARPDSLKLHIRVHTGEKPYKCSLCDKAFTDQSNLKVHRGLYFTFYILTFGRKRSLSLLIVEEEYFWLIGNT